MPNIKYSGYINAQSGMGEACRNYIKALHTAGVSVTTQIINNIEAKSDLGEAHKLATLLWGKDLDYKIKIIHSCPNEITQHLEPMKYHIFHLFWETDRLPAWWVWALNLVDEVWTGSEWSKGVFIESGVTKPIYVFPQPVEPIPESAGKYTNKELKGKTVFYSIFQWIERKDPKSLLKCFWEEFKDNDDVCLLIKTYREKFTDEERSLILRELDSWKKELNQDKYPDVYVEFEELTRKDIQRFHNTGDCFVLPHRGEGWGIPIAEAMSANKPVIATNLGGISEHVPVKNWYPVGCEKTTVFNMDWVPWYDNTQKWGSVNKMMLKEKMREVYEHQKKAESKGYNAGEFVRDHFSYMNVGRRLKERIMEIERNL